MDGRNPYWGTWYMMGIHGWLVKEWRWLGIYPIVLRKKKNMGSQLLGRVPHPICQNVTNYLIHHSLVDTTKVWRHPPNYDFAPGSLWICVAHGQPYIPLNRIGHCTRGHLHLPATVQQALPWCPTNWNQIGMCIIRNISILNGPHLVITPYPFFCLQQVMW